MIVEMVLKYGTAPVFSMGIQGQNSLIRELNTVLLDEYPNYILEDEFLSFWEYEKEKESSTWCEDKRSVDNFNVYSFDDFKMLWLICFVGILLSTSSEFFIRTIKHATSKIFIGNPGLRDNADSHIVNSSKRTFSIWTTFSLCFVESFMILRASKTLAKLKKIKEKIGKNGRPENTVFKINRKKTEFEKIQRKDTKVVSESPKNAKKMISEREISKATLKQQKRTKKETAAKKSMEYKWFRYFDYTEFFFKRIVSSSLEFLLVHNKSHFYSKTPPLVQKVSWGQPKTYYVLKPKETKWFLRLLPKFLKLKGSKSAFGTQVKSSFFEVPNGFYSEKVKSMMINHFMLNDAGAKQLKEENPDFETKIREILEVEDVFVNIFSQLIGEVHKMAKKHSKKIVLVHYQIVRKKILKKKRKSEAQKSIRGSHTTRRLKMGDDLSMPSRHLVELERQIKKNPNYF